MQKPTSIIFRGKARWDCGPAGLAEYALWSIGEAATPSDLMRFVAKEFDVTVRHELMGAYLQQLVRTKRVVKLLRGIYIHADRASIFD